MDCCLLERYHGVKCDWHTNRVLWSACLCDSLRKIKLDTALKIDGCTIQGWSESYGKQWEWCQPWRWLQPKRSITIRTKQIPTRVHNTVNWIVTTTWECLDCAGNEQRTAKSIGKSILQCVSGALCQLTRVVILSYLFPFLPSSFQSLNRIRSLHTDMYTVQLLDSW